MASAAVKARITAEDKGSSTLAALNKRMVAVNKGLAQTQAPFVKLAENYRRFVSLTGAGQIAGGLASVARTGFGAFQAVTRIIEPLGVIAGAASIAGMYRLATAWANFGTQLGQTAARAGLSAEQLHRLENAGRLAGVSAEAVAGGMTALRDGMVKATAGQAPQVVGMLQALGLSVGDARRFAADTTTALPELADKIAALHDPTLQAEAATTLFGAAGEQLLPFLRRGSAGIAEYEQRADRYGVMNDQAAQAANRLREAQASLGLAVEGLGNSIAQQLAPTIGPLLTQLADWIAANRDWIAQGIGEKAKAVADFLGHVDWAGIGHTIGSVASGAQAVADALGGWEKAGLVVLGFFAAAWLAKVTLVIAQVSKLFARIPGEAGDGARGPGGLGGLVGKALIANQLVSAADGDDAFGAWMDKNVPGAAWLDNAASSIGFGRSYAEQARVEGVLHPGTGGGPAPGAQAPAGGSGAQANPRPEDAAYKPVLDMLGKSEGTDKGRGYNETLGYGAYTGGARNLTGMTLDQIDQMQNEMLSNPRNAMHSSAAGRYQFTQTTLRDMRRKYGISGDTLFDEKMQDHLAVERMKMGGPITQDSLAKIWASVPTTATGHSFYGQGTGISTDEVQAALKAVAAAPSGPDRSLPPNAGTAASPGGAAPASTGQVQPTLRVVGAPAGTTVVASSSGGVLAPMTVERRHADYD